MKYMCSKPNFKECQCLVVQITVWWHFKKHLVLEAVVR